jgi:hypothetical protein
MVQSHVRIVTRSQGNINNLQGFTRQVFFCTVTPLFPAQSTSKSQASMGLSNGEELSRQRIACKDYRLRLELRPSLRHT